MNCFRLTRYSKKYVPLLVLAWCDMCALEVPDTAVSTVVYTRLPRRRRVNGCSLGEHELLCRCAGLAEHSIIRSMYQAKVS